MTITPVLLATVFREDADRLAPLGRIREQAGTR
jgi:hypothetical protein